MCIQQDFYKIGSIIIGTFVKDGQEKVNLFFFFFPFPPLRARLKYIRMRHYHKELCKREQQAKTRNLELLRSAESLVLKAKEFSVDYTVLHHLKVFLLANVLQNAYY